VTESQKKVDASRQLIGVNWQW